MTLDELTAIVRREFIDQVRDLDNPHWKAQTPDYLKEVCAKAGYPKPDEAADFFARAAAQAVRKAVIEECINAIGLAFCKAEGISSLRHHHMYDQYTAALRSLKGETDDAA